MKRVMVFGVFDGFHPGHRSFLTQAAKHGKIIAVVARDSSVKNIKGRMPRERQHTRLRRIRNMARVRFAVLGDMRQGTYAVIKKYKPDLICLGYDQRFLAADLRKKMRQGATPRIKVVKLKAYYPRKFHSSKMK